MTWNETCAMDQKMLFVTACIDGNRNISCLCRHFGISRKTGYKWVGMKVVSIGVAGNIIS